MKKLLLSLVVMLALAVIAPVFAGEEEKAEFHGFGDDLELEHLYLYQKDHANDWEVVEKGASGKLHYTPFGSEFKFVFNGHKMDPGTDYTLIYYPDPWPGNGLICLGTDVSNKGGNVHIADVVDTGYLPKMQDYNNVLNPNHEECYGESTCIDDAKIWLVLSSDVDCSEERMSGWNPNEYLFEDVGITFNDVALEILENKDSSWNVVEDNIYGLLLYGTEGPTFAYEFAAYGLATSTDYSLIYYADGWPGNNPGALIGSSTSDGSGNFLLSGNPDLGMTLPHEDDENFGIGAKVWLVPSSHYNSASNSLVTFSRPQYLFETNFVNYVDTDL